MTSTLNNSITRIHNPSKQEFLNLWKQGKAFIINGVADQWDACHKWSNEYLEDVCGDRLIPVEAYNQDFSNDCNYSRQEYYRPIYMEFKDYIDAVKGKQKDDRISYYMSQVDFQKFFPELLRDIAFPNYFSQSLKTMFFFFGFSNKKYTSVTYLHFDEVHNIFAQMRGRKRFLLFPPSNYLSFYPPISEKGYSPAWSRVNPDSVDLELYPKFPHQDKIEVILEPGEILYIPPFWWHHVTGLEENISLTFWYPLTIKDLIAQKGFFRALLQIAPNCIPFLINGFIKESFDINKIKKILKDKLHML